LLINVLIAQLVPLTVNVIAAAAFVFLVVLSVYCLPFVANKDD